MILKTIKRKIIFQVLAITIILGLTISLFLIKLSHLPWIQNFLAYTSQSALNLSIIISLMIAIGFFLASVYIIHAGYILLKPIRIIREMIENIGKGQFEAVKPIDNNSEFKELSSIISDIAKKFKNEQLDLKTEISKRTMEISKQNLKAVNTNKAILNILEDIEKEKTKAASLAKSLEKFKLALDSTIEYVVITDAKGEVVYANKGVEDITGYKINEILGKKIKEMWDLHLNKEKANEMQHALEVDKKPFVTELIVPQKNGSQYNLSLTVSPVLNNKNELEFLVNIARDITKEKEVDKAKTEFVSLASHQLRTPLSSINWYTEMLIANDIGKLNKKQTEFIKEIYDSNKRMIDLVNSLLSASRLELGTFSNNPEPTNIVELASSVLDELKPDITTKKLKIIFSASKDWPLIEADPKFIRIIFQNILSNAVKYTPNKGEIKLTIDKDDKKISIKISDTGYGIPASQTDKIFEKLFRADNIRQKDTEGTGLGLYLVKSIVNKCGGRIWFESKENQGTTFFIELPFNGLKSAEEFNLPENSGKQ